ncbi:MAG: PAS domain-containing protein, partial [Verrucomicrobia bacterium]|nr:PAS domain-containing protein [Verrucomicrobiota bacterium]
MEQGQQAMEPIRQLADRITALETARLKERQAIQDQDVKGTEGFAVLVSLLGMGLFAILLALFARANRRRHRAEAVLQQNNLELEQRVGQRTAELSQTVELLRTLVDALPDLVFTKDTAGRFSMGNTAELRHLGLARETDLIGKTVFDFYPRPLAESYGADDQRVLAGEPLLNREEPGVDAAGQARWYLTIKVPLRDPAGKIIGLVGTSRDITERTQAEQKLQTQLSRLDLLNRITRAIGERQDLRSMFQVVIRSLEDNLSIDFGCVCLYDATMETLTVTSVGVRSGALAMELALTDQARIDIDQNGLSRCVGGQLVYEPDLRQVHFPFPERLARGGLRSLVTAPLLVESQVFGVLVVARRQPQGFASPDCEFLRQLSEHVALAAHHARLYGALQRAYDELRLTQQAVMQQERLRALGQMASGIAHDINNAISPAALYTESLLEREPNLSERAREYLATIQRAIEDVAQTVSRLREFYRPTRPQQKDSPDATVGRLLWRDRSRVWAVEAIDRSDS